MKSSYFRKISARIEAASLVPFGQNTILLGKTITLLFQGETFSKSHFLILSVTIINMISILSSWASSKIYEKEYDTNMLMLDIITLGIFYLQVYVLSELCKEQMVQIETLFIIISSSYILICILFMLWNNCALFNTNDEKKKQHTIRANKQHILSITCCCGLLILTIFKMVDIFNLVLLYIFFIIWWFRVLIFRNKNNQTVDILFKK